MIWCCFHRRQGQILMNPVLFRHWSCITGQRIYRCFDRLHCSRYCSTLNPDMDQQRAFDTRCCTMHFISVVVIVNTYLYDMTDLLNYHSLTHFHHQLPTCIRKWRLIRDGSLCVKCSRYFEHLLCDTKSCIYSAQFNKH